MYWFFSLSPCIQWVFIQDLWWLTSFCRKKLPAMAAERIRTKKLLAEVTKDLTPEQINGKSVSVFKKNVKETFRWSHVKKKRSASLSSWMCTEYTGKVFFSSLKKTYNFVTKVLEMLIICIIDIFFVNIQVYFNLLYLSVFWI